MRYLIFGPGFLGTRLNYFLHDSHLSGKRIGSIEDALVEIEEHDPDVVINCVGKSGKQNITWCEEHKEETYFGNVVVPLFIAKACRKTFSKMVHIGTGYIYQGGPFDEADAPNYLESCYSASKYAAEEFLKAYNVLQLRIQLPFDYEENSRNLITKFKNFPKISDVKNSITNIEDLAKAIGWLSNSDANGIFNVVNPEPISNKEILKILGLKKEIIKGEDIKRPVCLLSTKKLNQCGVYLRPTAEALKECAKRYEESNAIL